MLSFCWVKFSKAGFTILADPVSLKIDFPQDEIVTSRSYLRSQPDVVTRYLKAIIEAIHYYHNNPEEGVRVMGKYLRVQDGEALEETYKVYREVYQPLPLPSLQGMQVLLEWMAQRDSRAKEAKAEQFIDSSLLREIEKSGFVASLYQR